MLQMKNILKCLTVVSLAGLMMSMALQAQNYNGLGSTLGDLYRLSDAKTRSISPENLTGKKGKGGMATLEEGNASHAARDLGQGWKVNPYIFVQPGEERTLAEIDGSGAIQQIWMTPAGIPWRFATIRFYWDDETEPSVEAPVSDFFCSGLGEYKQISSVPVCVNPGSAVNCYWIMPFRKKCRITMENMHDEKPLRLYYQINYTLTEVPEGAAYFHAQFRLTNSQPYKQDYVMIDGVKGKGHYVGTYMTWQTNSNGWWGEGEIKFFMDGDTEFPTICGTGTEDYFCGSYGFSMRDKDTNERSYVDYTTPYAGFHVSYPQKNVLYHSQTRFGLYRWHIVDPVRFEEDLKVTMQTLGWQDGGRYRPLQDAISSVVYWYQTEPHSPFPEYPSKDELDNY